MQEIKNEDPDIHMPCISQSDRLILRNDVLKVSESQEILDLYCQNTKYGLDRSAALFEQLLSRGRIPHFLEKKHQNKTIDY